MTLQSAQLMRWLYDGPGAKGKTKELVKRYIEALRSVLRDIDEKGKADSEAAKKKLEEEGPAQPPSEEEEEKEQEEEPETAGV